MPGKAYPAKKSAISKTYKPGKAVGGIKKQKGSKKPPPFTTMPIKKGR
jgi:hypothetical protein